MYLQLSIFFKLKYKKYNSELLIDHFSLWDSIMSKFRVLDMN